MTCTSIPNLIELENYGGNYSEYEAAVYNLYFETFESHQFSLLGKPIYQKKYPMIKDKSATFWHIISSSTDENNREPDLRRYERIAWPAFLLGYCKDYCDDLLIWKNNRNGKTRVLLWCRDIDYVVILDEREKYCLFWTAYPIVYEHTRQKLFKEYSAYKKQEALA